MYKSLSKYLCKLLRHHPELARLDIDEEGYVSVEQLINNVNEYSKYHITKEILEQIVREDEKTRYGFNEDHTFICCYQGHSIPIVGTLDKATPPNLLYHGTASKSTPYIDKEGLKSMNRNYVHLSSDIETASKVGARHGSLVIYKVDCKAMIKDGYEFYISKNKVWQVKEVPVKYLSKLNK